MRERLSRIASTAPRRHALLGTATLVLVVAFHRQVEDWSLFTTLNRAVADAALVLAAVAVAIGPFARVFRPFEKLVSVRREIGIWAVIASLLHVWFILADWVDWDVTRLWLERLVGRGQPFWVFDPAWATGNLLGVVALGYGLLLLLTSNDAAQRLLGSGWKYVQRASFTFFVLAALHATYFVYFHFAYTYHNPGREANWFGPVLVGLVVVVALAKLSAFVRTVLRRGTPE